MKLEITKRDEVRSPGLNFVQKYVILREVIRLIRMA